jgi:phytoene dehydrogenase-like protein
MTKMNKRFDAVVIGSGPNGLSAAIRLQQEGIQTLLLEAKDTIGGGTRTKELTLPGFRHDVCSAIHPMALASPFFKTLPLKKFGLEWIHPEVLAAHPFDDGTAPALYHSMEKTADQLGIDRDAYHQLIAPSLKHWEGLTADFLGPLKIPKHPLPFVRFGLNALLPAHTLAKLKFKTEKARGLWAGMAAHSIQPLSNLTTSAIGLVLMTAGHAGGWPIPKGGSQAIANALGGYFESLGGRIETGFTVKKLKDLPESKAVLFDLTPKQVLEIAGKKFSGLYKWQLERYKYGMGVFKIDWALSGPIPFQAEEARKAGTVHLGGTLEEIVMSEKTAFQGKHSKKPYVLLAQQSLFDSERAPKGHHTAWAYCHVPNGSIEDMTGIIENQVERFAPGFKKLILAKHTFNADDMHSYNANYIGGDINGGVQDITQLFTRPALRLSPYRTSEKGIYICSSSTPPGGGVHGMCGFHAAEQLINDLF